MSLIIENNSYLKIKDYFESLVSNHTRINEFVGFFSKDLHKKLRKCSSMASPYLALFKYELGLDGPEQNTIAVRKLGFALMRCDLKSDDIEGQYKCIDDCEQLALSVLARIRFDSNNRKHFLYNTLLKDSIRILPVELSSMRYGVEVYFSLKNPQSLVLNVGDYKDVDNIC